MFALNESYSDNVDITDNENYPLGKAKDCTTPDTADGTPILAKLVNDIIGGKQAVLREAYGVNIAHHITNNPDTAKDSDFARAIVKLYSDADTALFEEVKRLIIAAVNYKIVAVHAIGVETIIPWAAIGVEYEVKKRYAAIATLRENYAEFMPIGTEVHADGVHIFPRRLVDGRIVAGTRGRVWGLDAWGEGVWGSYSHIEVNLIIHELR